MTDQTVWDFTLQSGITSMQGTFTTASTPSSTVNDYWYDVTSINGTVTIAGEGTANITGLGSEGPTGTQGIPGNAVSQTEGFQTYSLNIDTDKPANWTGPTQWGIGVSGRELGIATLTPFSTINGFAIFTATPETPLPKDPNPVNAITELNHPPCFCGGTLIKTARGDVAVEDLLIGDMVLTISGDMKPVIWIGTRQDSARNYPVSRRHEFQPVCFKAGSLGPDMPTRDFYVSPLHGIYVDGVRICAFLLINGSTIVRATEVQEMEYFHIELSEHSILQADGAWSESYFEFDNFHRKFDNGATYPLQHNRPARHAHCCPMIWESEQLDRIKACLLDYA
ncbi:hypothetical protein NCH01_14260 [Neoasaia chiangmaiensis]|nr:Hint domain-containing protein [Neoasaia chiangmaiensis]GEN14995.1 hypothetical protein NCH01_14260 [Neoasaia chiangmaiensis]